MKFAIRCDASKEIGYGHVMRCVGLAEQLLKHNHDVAFYYYECPDEVLAKAPARAAMFEVDKVDFVPTVPDHILIVDSYRVKADHALYIKDHWWFMRDELREVRRSRSKLQNVLVSFGGSESEKQKPYEYHATNECPGVVFQVAQFKAYPSQLNWADMVLGASGVSAWERAHLGIPALMVPAVTNQLENYQAITMAFAGIPLGNIEQSLPLAMRWVNILSHNPGIFQTMSVKAMQMARTDSFDEFWAEVKRQCLS